MTVAAAIEPIFSRLYLNAAISGIIRSLDNGDFGPDRLHPLLERFYAERREQMEALGIWTGGMFATVGSSGFLYEIAMYWPDEITAYHRSVVPEDYLKDLPSFPANPQARAFVHEMKNDLAALYAEHGAVNFQIGRFYPYSERLSSEARELLGAVKTHLDPEGRLSPGVLGLQAQNSA